MNSTEPPNVPKRLLKLIHQTPVPALNPEMERMGDQLREIYERLQRATNTQMKWPEVEQRYHERRRFQRRKGF
jgi:hypothetical protein